ncbi:hypothetical protein ACIBSV_08375 [Embleya sp. NPDC050154]|uniref:hypothetical protein n=1 Tax=unclassified Embleya TaxID=2699296 RepID=UPI00378B2B48
MGRSDAVGSTVRMVGPDARTPIGAEPEGGRQAWLAFLGSGDRAGIPQTRRALSRAAGVGTGSGAAKVADQGLVNRPGGGAR